MDNQRKKECLRAAAVTKAAEEAGVEPTGDAFAPPNGFEDRAGHRTRYSSIEGLSASLGKLSSPIVAVVSDSAVASCK
jgi:hypothetical protein